MKRVDNKEKEWVLGFNIGSSLWVDPVSEKDLKEGYAGRTTWNSEKAYKYIREQVEAAMDIMRRNGI